MCSLLSFPPIHLISLCVTLTLFLFCVSFYLNYWLNLWLVPFVIWEALLSQFPTLFTQWPKGGGEEPWKVLNGIGPGSEEGSLIVLQGEAWDQTYFIAPCSTFPSWVYSRGWLFSFLLHWRRNDAVAKKSHHFLHGILMSLLTPEIPERQVCSFPSAASSLGAQKRAWTLKQGAGKGPPVFWTASLLSTVGAYGWCVPKSTVTCPSYQFKANELLCKRRLCSFSSRLHGQALSVVVSSSLSRIVGVVDFIITLSSFFLQRWSFES